MITLYLINAQMLGLIGTSVNHAISDAMSEVYFFGIILLVLHFYYAKWLIFLYDGKPSIVWKDKKLPNGNTCPTSSSTSSVDISKSDEESNINNTMG